MSEWVTGPTKNPTSNNRGSIMWFSGHCTSLQFDNDTCSDIEFSSFADILLHNVRSVYVGDIVDAPVVCERFSYGLRNHKL